MDLRLNLGWKASKGSLAVLGTPAVMMGKGLKWCLSSMIFWSMIAAMALSGLLNFGPVVPLPMDLAAHTAWVVIIPV
eukprot:2611884-Lingulodinium_polyedra.AAC.1